MIPRKEAKRLIDEYLERVYTLEDDGGDSLDADGLTDVRDRLLAESDLVLRGAENVEQKARRYLTEGRLTVTSVVVDPGGLIVAEARGVDGVYNLGYDPRNSQWRCTCRSGRKGHCSHIIALKLVTDTTTRGAT